MPVDLAEHLLADAHGEIVEPGFLALFLVFFESIGKEVIVEAEIEFERVFGGRRFLVGLRRLDWLRQGGGGRGKPERTSA